MSTELVAAKRTNRLHQISVEIFFQYLKMVSPLFYVGLLLGKSAKENRKRAVSTEVTLIFLRPHHQVVVQNLWAVFQSLLFPWNLLGVRSPSFDGLLLAFIYHRCGPDVTSWPMTQMKHNRNHVKIRRCRSWYNTFLWPRCLRMFGNCRPWDFKCTQSFNRGSCPSGCPRTVTLCGRCVNYDVPACRKHPLWLGWTGCQYSSLVAVVCCWQSLKGRSWWPQG